jgi:hypothetical protein
MGGLISGPVRLSDGADSEFDDVEWELSCSAREVAGGCVPLSHLDFAAIATALGRCHATAAFRTDTDLSATAGPLSRQSEEGVSKGSTSPA